MLGRGRSPPKIIIIPGLYLVRKSVPFRGGGYFDKPVKSPSEKEAPNSCHSPHGEYLVYSGGEDSLIFWEFVWGGLMCASGFAQVGCNPPVTGHFGATTHTLGPTPFGRNAYCIELLFIEKETITVKDYVTHHTSVRQRQGSGECRVKAESPGPARTGFCAPLRAQGGPNHLTKRQPSRTLYIYDTRHTTYDIRHLDK